MPSDPQETARERHRPRRPAAVGPEPDLLGDRQPEVYGTASLDDHVATATAAAARLGLDVEHLQSNREGDLIEAVHGARGRCAAIVVNPAAFTHYAWGLHDALAAFDGPVVEVHLSNPDAREPWRRTSVVSPVANGHDLRVRGRRIPPGPRGGGARCSAGRGRDRPGGPAGRPPPDGGRRPRRTGSASGWTAPASTPSSSARSPTSATSPASPGRPGSSSSPPTRWCWSPTAATGSRRPTSWHGAGVAARLEITSTEQRAVVTAALAGTARVGLEADHVSWATQRRYQAEWFPDTELVPTTGLVEGLRRLKDAGELARMELAAAVADAALAEVRPGLANGLTEAELALELDTAMRRLGRHPPELRDDRRVGAQRGPPPRPARARGPSGAATWSCSTSARSSTATAPT